MVTWYRFSEIPRLAVQAADFGGESLARRTLDEWRDADGTVLGSSGYLGDLCFVRVNGIADFVFDLESSPVGATPERSASHEQVEDAYLRVALPLVLQARGTEVLHASANLTPAGLLLICGNAGSGKSTLCCGLAQRGYPPLADDAVAFRFDDEGAFALPMPFRLRLRPDAASCFLGPDDGSLHYRASVSPNNCDQPRPLRIAHGLILDLERSTGLEITVDPIRRGPELVTSLLPHAYAFTLGDPDRKRRIMQEYMSLATHLPWSAVKLGRGLDAIDRRLDVIESLLSEQGLSS